MHEHLFSYQGETKKKERERERWSECQYLSVISYLICHRSKVKALTTTYLLVLLLLHSDKGNNDGDGSNDDDSNDDDNDANAFCTKGKYEE